MAEVLLTLIMPDHAAQAVEDLLLSRQDLVPGFTAARANGHGSGVELLSPAERVAGHAPRTVLQVVGPEEAMRRILDLVKAEAPHASVFFYLSPVIEAGRL